MSVSVSVFPTFSFSVCLSVCLPSCLSVYLSVCFSPHSLCVSLSLSVCIYPPPPLSLSLSLSVPHPLPLSLTPSHPEPLTQHTDIYSYLPPSPLFPPHPPSVCPLPSSWPTPVSREQLHKCMYDQGAGLAITVSPANSHPSVLCRLLAAARYLHQGGVHVRRLAVIHPSIHLSIYPSLPPSLPASLPPFSRRLRYTVHDTGTISNQETTSSLLASTRLPVHPFTHPSTLPPIYPAVCPPSVSIPIHLSTLVSIHLTTHPLE